MFDLSEGFHALVDVLDSLALLDGDQVRVRDLLIEASAEIVVGYAVEGMCLSQILDSWSGS